MAHCRAERVEVRGTEIVFLGYAFEKDKYYPGPPLYAQAGPDEIIADIQRVKSKDNIVVCSFHWGWEFITYPTFEQITLARRSVDAGCDLILGHHPHVLNGFECYKGKDVFYSLGNFLFDQSWNDDCRRSMAVRLQLARDEIRLERTDGIQIRDDYRPEPAADERFDERLGRMCVEIQEALENGGARHARDAERKRARNRYLSVLYLLTHLHRYDPVILRQIAAEAVGRRVRPWRTAAERAR